MENFDELARTWDNDPMRAERAKTVAEAILKTIPSHPSMDAFEYGCGTGLLSLNLQPYFHTITLGDSSQGMLKVLEEKIERAGLTNLRPVQMDLTKDDPIPAQRFDLIYTLLTLHHIKDLDKVFHAFAVMLKPLGWLCIADLDEEDGSFHGPDFSGHNGFNRNELAEQLVGYGFGDIRMMTCYENIKRSQDGAVSKYPMFLLVGQKKKGERPEHIGKTIK
ncbi:MAG TPA: class I SAM-dependent methyltransferase [Bacillota bacterium]|nr:class I SAM-dependent methyltransferase [Bacillota bacterium]